MVILDFRYPSLVQPDRRYSSFRTDGAGSATDLATLSHSFSYCSRATTRIQGAANLHEFPFGVLYVGCIWFSFSLSSFPVLLSFLFFAYGWGTGHGMTMSIWLQRWLLHGKTGWRWFCIKSESHMGWTFWRSVRTGQEMSWREHFSFRTPFPLTRSYCRAAHIPPFPISRWLCVLRLGRLVFWNNI